MVQEFHTNLETSHKAVQEVLTTVVKSEVQRHLMKTSEYQHQIFNTEHQRSQFFFNFVSKYCEMLNLNQEYSITVLNKSKAKLIRRLKVVPVGSFNMI